MHLGYRIASSPDACAETLRRHLAYLDRALNAAERGERLSRASARRLFGLDEDFQLELGLRRDESREGVDPRELLAERRRVSEIAEWLKARGALNPKAGHLQEVLRSRGRRKTIVFTVAVATARDLARRLGWRRVAVVSGRGAWIASGPVPVEEALRLFAPLARGGPEPGPAEEVTTLIATDLASEGLDLQDADAVVHYDIPWTPLRLEQRLGRIARLGSSHASVAVWWFAPPAALDARLGLSRRIAAKVACQMSLGVTTSSRVGQARILSHLFDWKERLARPVEPRTGLRPCFSVVRGPRAAAFALRWSAGTRVIPELIVIENQRLVEDERRRGTLVEQLLEAPEAPGLPPAGDVDALTALVRRRLSAALRGATDDRSRHLARLLACRAAEAARKREADLLSLLDLSLDRVGAGLSEGGSRGLERVLNARLSRRALGGWMAASPPAWGSVWTATLEGALFGTALFTEPPG